MVEANLCVGPVPQGHRHRRSFGCTSLSSSGHTLNSLIGADTPATGFGWARMPRTPGMTSGRGRYGPDERELRAMGALVAIGVVMNGFHEMHHWFITLSVITAWLQGF